MHDRVARTDRYVDGLRRLMAAAATHQVAVVCSEEAPTRCDRRLLITPELLNDDNPPTVLHIPGDGRIVNEAELVSCRPEPERQLSFFRDSNDG